ncbi:MAG: GNAT family N-acetyltransferase [Streptosporangiales bacterium]
MIARAETPAASIKVARPWRRSCNRAVLGWAGSHTHYQQSDTTRRRSMQHNAGMAIVIRVRFPVDNHVLNALHARSFGSSEDDTVPWAKRLERHALTWAGAFNGGDLIGFVQVVWDGGAHAFLLDTVVDPSYQRQGIGHQLVEAVQHEVAKAGCQWLHVDFEPHLNAFYIDACGFRTTDAGLLKLRP